MSIELYPSVAKVKRGGVYQNLPGFVPESGADAAQAMIANEETSSTAQYTHATGSYFRLNGTLYEATTDIRVNDVIVVGTNCKVAVLGNDVAELKSDLTSQSAKIEELEHGENYTIRRFISFLIGGLGLEGQTVTSSNRARCGEILRQTNATVVVSCDPRIEYRIAIYSGLPIGRTTFIEYINDFTSLDTVISTGKYFKVLARYVADPSSVISDITDFTKNIFIQFIYSSKLKTLRGKTFSLLGDSISAFAGDIPSGYDAYYTGDNDNVNSKDEMWYSILANITGLTPLIINAYSGSGITQLNDSAHINKIPISADERCSGLSNGTTNPDIIIIAGGLNDYSYALSAQNEPLPWDGKTTPVLSNSFTEAYACMIKKLQTNYPNAIVVALSTFFSMRGDDNGYTLTHTVGNNTYTQADYDNAIKNVCDLMNIPFVDISKVGFNRNNYYPNFAQDSANIPTHPSKFGHSVIGQFLASSLPDLVIPLIEGWVIRN